MRPVNFPVEDGQLLTQGEILRREGCSGDDQAPDEQKESGDEDHKCEANHRKKDEPDERAEWLMIPLTASKSTRDGVFGRDRRIRSRIVTLAVVLIFNRKMYDRKIGENFIYGLLRNYA